MREAHHAAGVARCEAVDLAHRAAAEELLGIRGAGLAEAVPDHLHRLLLGHGAQVDLLVHAVGEVGHRLNRVSELGLSEDDDLKELLGVGLEVEEDPQDLERPGRELLPLVEKEHWRHALLERGLEDQGLEPADAGLDGAAPRGIGVAHELKELSDEREHVPALGVKQQVRGDALGRAQTREERAAERALAASDGAVDDVEPPLQAQRDLEPVEAELMGLGGVEALRIRRVREGLAAESDDLEVVHICSASSCGLADARSAASRVMIPWRLSCARCMSSVLMPMLWPVCRMLCIW